jgi:gliding motility-associated-like protein
VFADANFQFVTAQCAIPATVDFINLSSGAVSYEWDFGDGSPISTLAQPQHTYATSGTYQVSLIAADSNTCNGKDTFYLSVFVPPPLLLSVSPSDTLCAGGSSNVNCSGSNSPTFVWSPAAGLSNPNIANPVATPSQSTTYTVIATDTNGCVDTQTVYIHVHPKPAASFSESFVPCTIPVTVNALNTSSGTSTFSWTFSDGGSAVTTDAQHVFTASGYYTLTLIAHDETGCGFDDTASVTIYLPPPAVITATGSDSICTGQSIPVSASGGATYLWSPPLSVDNPTSPNPNAFPEITTNYFVIGTDTNGCSDTAMLSIYVFPPASLDAGVDEIFDFAIGSPTLNPSIPGNGTFFWSPTTGLSCTNCLNPVATPEVTTTYYLTFTDIYGCTYVDSVTVYVSPSLFIPNAFTNNADGFNDYFQVFARNLSKFEIQVFNRWGQLIFESTDPTQLWDGTYKGIKCEIGVYVWKVTYADQINPNDSKIKFGHVTLLR